MYQPTLSRPGRPGGFRAGRTRLAMAAVLATTGVAAAVVPGTPGGAAPPLTATVQLEPAPADRTIDRTPRSLAAARSSTGGSDATTATITLATLLLATGLACIGGSRRRTRIPRSPRQRN